MRHRDTATAGFGIQAAGKFADSYIAAAGLGADIAIHVVRMDIAGTRFGMNSVSNIGKDHVAGPGLQINRSLQADSVLVS